MGVGIPKRYSQDLRERVIAAVAGAAKPTGGSVSPLDDHERALRALVAEKPDLRLAEFCAVL